MVELQRLLASHWDFRWQVLFVVAVIAISAITVVTDNKEEHQK